MQNSEKPLDIINLEIQWQHLTGNEKIALIESCAEHGPDKSIDAVLLGINTHDYSVRTRARRTLDFIRSTLGTRLQDKSDKKRYYQNLKISARVSAKIFSQLVPGTPVEEQLFFFKTLLSIEGTGPMFAFRALYLNYLDITAAEKLVLTLAEEKRLKLTAEYLKADPGLRLKFGPAFKRIAASVKQLDTAVTFYAGLFDAGQDADPFLNNIPPVTRDPEKIITSFVRSESPVLRTRGLKALAMITSKIDSPILVNILKDDSDFEVKKTVYRIIENSALGTYPDLFDPLFVLLKQKKPEEAIYAFKALIVSGKLPLQKVLDFVREKHSNLLGHVYREISRLSKISFFFIQDIALNPDIYKKKYLEINLAAIFGIIKKRPERVVKLLKMHLPDSPGSHINFIKTTERMLIREKKSIMAGFAAISKQADKEPLEQKGLLSNLFSSATRSKKISRLKTGNTRTPVDFEGEYFSDIELSGLTCNRSAANFNRTAFKNCQILDSLFFNTYFKEAVFIGTDLSGSTFDNTSFENATFINVNTENSVFKNCNFANFSAYNCTFNGSQMSGALFIDATLSNCRFRGTDLSGSSFAFSRLSAQTFEDADLDQADLSHIRARFCRFPFHVRTATANDTVDLNARKYQLTLDDMPELDDLLISKINLLIFSEFIHYGERKFIRQNHQSLLTAYDIFKPRQSDLFMMIPYLLHYNITLPGFQKRCNPATPNGIYDFHADPQTLAAVARYKKGGTLPKNPKEAAIEALYTIGSIGSVAQTDDSDIDYWVCINKDKLPKDRLNLLELKLKIMEKFALEQFSIQITFFIVDITQAQQNNFGGSTTESSGSAQALLLKEEFYRTMIHVAGKLPLWSVLPTAVSKQFYSPIFKVIASLPNLARYIDLGDIRTIPAGEFFGATVWQLFKGLKSPFKSVIKIALLEKYIHDAGQKPLLCNSVKDEWMNSGVNLRLAQNDSYYIMLKNMIRYYESNEDTESIWMLLTCFFLKLGISDSAAIDNSIFGLRGMLLSKCLDRWSWSKDKLYKTGRYKSWPYKNIARLSVMIESFLIKKYKMINTVFSSSKEGSIMISPVDRTVLGRKIYSELSRRPGKVSKVLLISGRDAHFHSLHLNHAANLDHGASWELISGHAKARQSSDTILQAKSIEEIGAWLLLNRIYHKSLVLNLIPNPTRITADDLRELLNAMYDHLAPAIQRAVRFDQLLEKSTPVSVFAAVNMYAPRQQQAITDYCAVYINSWGEMFVRSWASLKGMSSMEEMVSHMKKNLKVKKLPLATAYYTCGKPHLFNLFKTQIE